MRGNESTKIELNATYREKYWEKLTYYYIVSEFARILCKNLSVFDEHEDNFGVGPRKCFIFFV